MKKTARKTLNYFLKIREKILKIFEFKKILIISTCL